MGLFDYGFEKKQKSPSRSLHDGIGLMILLAIILVPLGMFFRLLPYLLIIGALWAAFYYGSQALGF